LNLDGFVFISPADSAKIEQPKEKPLLPTPVPILPKPAQPNTSLGTEQAIASDKTQKILRGDKAELTEIASKKGDKAAKLVLKKSLTKITSLPIRVLTILFEHVSTPKAFLSLSRTCKIFRQVIAQEDLQKKN